MCGIAGFWQNKAVDEHPLDILERMGATLAYRGPDDSGTFYDSSFGLGFSFRRLSIMDLSPDGHQPMSSASGRYTIIFNGEVYNFGQLRDELGAHAWRGRSDTEVMLAAIERWGLHSAVERFIGMFAFALWDREERRLYLVRDRIGIKPLYYGFIGGNFVFASELKALREFPGFDRPVDRNALALYMRFAYVPAPHCIYEGVYKLRAGHILCLSSPNEEPVLTPFWSAFEIARQGSQSPVQASDAEVVKELEARLISAVGLRMVADVPLGAFLSGGIDSSTVVALMQAQSNRPVKTFSIGFNEAAYNEAIYARKVADHLGTDHTEFYVTPKEAMDVIPLLPTMYDEPFADSSQIPTHLVSRLARQHVTVSLSGDGGDELFGGYSRYFFFHSVWGTLRRIPRPLARGMAKLLHAMPPAKLDHFLKIFPLPQRLKASPGEKLHKLGDFLAAGTPEAIYLYAISQWKDPDALVLGGHEPDTVSRVISEVNWLPFMEERAMLTDLTNYLPDDILTKLDRASMAVSLEARVPLLDHRVVEFAWSLPLRYRIRDGEAKWALRQVLYRYVPRELVERPKMGFGVPVDQWLREPLREWAEDLLSEQRIRQDGYLAALPIRRVWQEHLSGARDWQYLLWPVLMFQMWISQASRPAERSEFISSAGRSR